MLPRIVKILLLNFDNKINIVPCTLCTFFAIKFMTLSPYKSEFFPSIVNEKTCYITTIVFILLDKVPAQLLPPILWCGCF